nr:Protein of unknown function DUF1075 domain containing protein [Haemonchus contortus]
MLPLTGCSLIVPAVTRRAVLSKVPTRMLSDKVSDAYKSTIKTPPETTAKDGTLHASIPRYEEQVKSDRLHGVDEASGIQPTKWQKRFLVMTRLYKSQSEIPQYVATSTMNRMHNRMRAICITAAVVIFYIIFSSARATTESKIIEDREALLAATSKE